MLGPLRCRCAIEAPQLSSPAAPAASRRPNCRVRSGACPLTTPISLRPPPLPLPTSQVKYGGTIGQSSLLNHQSVSSFQCVGPTKSGANVSLKN